MPTEPPQQAQVYPSAVPKYTPSIFGRRKGATMIEVYDNESGVLIGTNTEEQLQFLIDELEDTPRGFYAGAVGHISFNGDMDFAIAIRTIIAEGGRLSYRVGAGIVADSIPSKEFEETEKKAEGMARAIIRSAEESS